MSRMIAPGPAAAALLVLLSGCAGADLRPPAADRIGLFRSGVFEGGEITDGVDVAAITRQRVGGREHVEIVFSRWTGYGGEETPAAPLDRPVRYRLVAEEYPYGLRLYFGGTRAFSAYRQLPDLNERLRASPLLRRITPAVVLDDSAGEIFITMKRRVLFAFHEQSRPARIVIMLEPAPRETAPKRLFSLRTPSGLSGEPAGHLRERLAAETGAPVRWLADTRGRNLLEAGLFSRESEALAARERLARALPGVELIVEGRGPNTLPAYRPAGR